MMPQRRGARHPGPRPQSRGRRQGVQGGRACVPGAARLSRFALSANKAGDKAAGNVKTAGKSRPKTGPDDRERNVMELAEAKAETVERARVGGAALLAVDGVTIRFGGVTALQDVSFEVARGAICGLIGPNGAGKTTLFNCISRLYDPHAARSASTGARSRASPGTRSRRSASRARSRTSRCSPR